MGCVPSECVACAGCPDSPNWRWPGGRTQVLGHHPACAWAGCVRPARQAGHPQPPSVKQVPPSLQSTLFHSHNEDPCPSRLSQPRESQPLPHGLGSTCHPLGCPSPRLLVSHFAFLQDDSVPISLAAWPSQSLALFLPGRPSADFSGLRILWLANGSCAQPGSGAQQHPPSPSPQLESAPSWLLKPWRWSLRGLWQICSSALNTSVFGLFGSLIRNHMIF